jgi:membrane dipeptidase
MVNLVGVDHVGVGTDSPCSGPATAAGIVAEINAAYPTVTAGFVTQFGPGVEARFALPVWDLPLLTQELHRRGYKTDAIEKVMGGNFLRVFETVWH